jgi:hypothetical protein
MRGCGVGCLSVTFKAVFGHNYLLPLSKEYSP